MKKILCLLIVFSLLASIAGCSKNGTSSSDRDSHGKNSGQSTDNSGSDDHNSAGFKGDPIHLRTAASCEGSTLVIKDDGTLWGWGNNEYNLISSDSESTIMTPQKIMDDVVSVGAGYYYAMALKKDGSLWYWGAAYDFRSEKTDNNFTPVKLLDNVVNFSAGYRHCLAVCADGTLWAAGFNMYGQVDLSSKGRVITKPVQVQTDCVAAAAGSDHSYYLKKDKTLWGYGSGYHSVLGTEKNSTHVEPVKIMEDVIDVQSGPYIGYAIQSDNSLWGWGMNKYCEVQPHGKEVAKPVKILENVKSVSISSVGNHAVAVKQDSTVWGWGYMSSQAYNISNNLGLKNLIDHPYYDASTKTMRQVTQLPVEDIVHAVAGTNGTFLVTKDGQMYGCGRDMEYRFNNEDATQTLAEGIYGPVLEQVSVS